MTGPWTDAVNHDPEPASPGEPDDGDWPVAEDDPEIAEDDTPGAPDEPLRIGGVHWAVWVFIVLAIGDIVLRVSNGEVPTPYLSSQTLAYALAVIPTIVILLLPAALLIRHPEATRLARTLLFGMILAASVEALSILRDPLNGWFEQLTPASPDMAYLVPLTAVYDAFTSLVGALGLLYIAVGLSRARRFLDHGRIPTGVILVAFTIAVTVGRTVSVTRLDLSGFAMTPSLVAYFASFILLGVLNAVAWVYLAIVATAGSRAREDPVGGWRLAALGGLLIVLAIVVVTIEGVVDVTDSAVFSAVGWIRAGLFAIGHLALLLAFLVGLPELEEVWDAAAVDEPDWAGESVTAAEA